MVRHDVAGTEALDTWWESKSEFESYHYQRKMILHPERERERARDSLNDHNNHDSGSKSYHESTEWMAM